MLEKMLRNMMINDTMEIVKNDKVIHITKVRWNGFKIIEEDGERTDVIHAHTVTHWLKYHTVKRWVTY